MELSTAIGLLEKGVAPTAEAQSWADLGAGSGLFAQALATLLKEGSTIVAIDKDAAALKKIKLRASVALQTIAGDFSNEHIIPQKLDGILMANSLHFISDATWLLRRLHTHLHARGRFIVVEYDMEKPNPWVPYPVSKRRLQELASATGMGEVSFLNEVPSVYNRAMIYAALIEV